MRAGPLAISALVTCGVAWLLAAAFLAIDLLGRLPAARKRNASAFRLQLAVLLVLMTMGLLSQVGDLVRWANPVREAISLLTIAAAIGAVAVWIKAAMIQSAAKRAQAALEPKPD